MKLVAHIAPDQRGDEGADLGVVELGCDPAQTFVHIARVELGGELFTHLINEVLQVCVVAGQVRAGVKRGRACLGLNIDPQKIAGAAGVCAWSGVALLTVQMSCTSESVLVLHLRGGRVSALLWPKSCLYGMSRTTTAGCKGRCRRRDHRVCKGLWQAHLRVGTIALGRRGLGSDLNDAAIPGPQPVDECSDLIDLAL